MNHSIILGIVVIGIGLVALSMKNERKYNLSKILAIINIVLGTFIIVWGIFEG